MKAKRLALAMIWAPVFACTTFGSGPIDDAGVEGGPPSTGASDATIPQDGAAPADVVVPSDASAPDSADATTDAVADAPVSEDAGPLVDAFVPPEGGVGTPMRVFLTPETYAANFAPAGKPWAVADERCGASARARGVTDASWVAWIAYSGGNALTRLPDSVYWYQPGPGNPLVFPSKVAVAAGPLSPIVRDVAGQLVNRFAGTEYVWTGALSSGTDTNSCSDWSLTTSTLSGMAGRPDSVSTMAWTAYLLAACDATYHLYCFEVP